MSIVMHFTTFIHCDNSTTFYDCDAFNNIHNAPIYSLYFACTVLYMSQHMFQYANTSSQTLHPIHTPSEHVHHLAWLRRTPGTPPHLVPADKSKYAYGVCDGSESDGHKYHSGQLVTIHPGDMFVSFIGTIF